MVSNSRDQNTHVKNVVNIRSDLIVEVIGDVLKIKFKVNKLV